jgi:hypothetical protein
MQVGLASSSSQRIAPPPAPILFFATGRERVRGIADLHGRAKAVAVDGGEAADGDGKGAGQNDHTQVQ